MIAEPKSKRRKTEHSFSAEESDSASFHAFEELEDDITEVEPRHEEAEGNNAKEDNNESAISDAEDLDVETSEDNDLPSGAAADSHRVVDQALKPSRKTSSTHESRAALRASAAESSNGAYAANTFKSNLFRLQVDDLLSHIRPRRTTKELAVDDALHLLKRTIEQIPPLLAASIEDAERDLVKSSKVVVPFPQPRPPKSAQYTLEYAKPANINVVGSHVLRISSRSTADLAVDMSVQIPSSLLQEKDYLNYRYFYKRAFYLAAIAAGLKQKLNHQFEIRFSFLHGDQLKPIIVVSPRLEADSSSTAYGWLIKIMPCVAVDAFNTDKLLPDKNCIRSSSEPSKNGTTTSKSRPTSFYNASLRADMLPASYLKLINSTAKSCAAFRDACLLGTSWLRRRGFGADLSHGGLGSFEWSAIIALLLQGGGHGDKPMLSAGYSSYQMLKAVLQCFATKDFFKHPFSVGASGSPLTVSDNLSPIFWDAARAHNVLYRMSPWSYRLLRHEARSTLSMLGDQNFDGFEAAFVNNSASLLKRYDWVVEVPHRLMDSVPTADRTEGQSILEKLHRVLSRGLGDRVRLLSIISEGSKPWSLGSAPLSETCTGLKRIGLIVDAEKVSRTVDHGPAAESKSASAAFREFWGDKAELRRFKDGSILESLVWDTKAGATVVEQIVRHLLRTHFSHAAAKDAKLFGEGPLRLLRQRDSLSPFQPLMEAYKTLERDIRGLEALPLGIRQIMPSDQQLRFASISPPTESSSRLRPVDVTLQFEGSGRWPDDLVAIQRTKIAFLLKLSQLLSDTTDSAESHIGLEHEDANVLNQAFLNITYESGASFRLRIHHDREQTLFEQRLKDNTLDAPSKEIAALGLAKYKRDYLRTPAHTQAIAQLCNRFPALSGSMRLMKKWFACHLLSNHFSDKIIELMVARIFVQPWPYQAPSSVQTAFLRTLSWLAAWDWRAEPLLVDLSGSGAMKQTDRQSLQTRFEAWRKLDPTMNRVCIFAATNVDPDGTTYTDSSPAKVVAARMTALAKAACAEIDTKGLQLDISSLFASPLHDFDFVVHLSELAAEGQSKKRSKTSGHSAFKNLELAKLDNAIITSSNPALEFLQDLEAAYGQAVLLFYGGAERPVIAGLWSPQVARRAWKVNLTYSTIPVRGKDQDEVLAEANKDAILSEIARLGGDMVEKVEVFKH